MRHTKKPVGLRAAIVLFVAATAGLSPTDASAFEKSGRVTVVYIEGNRTVFGLDAPKSCPDGHYHIESDNPRQDHLTLLVISALAGGRRVTVRGAVCQAHANGRAVVGDMFID